MTLTFERLKVSLGAGTMGLWMNTIGAQRLPPLITLMHEMLLTQPVVHSDETPLQVLKSEKPVSSDHYMMVRAAGPPGRRIVLFNYEPNRNVAAVSGYSPDRKGRMPASSSRMGLDCTESSSRIRPLRSRCVGASRMHGVALIAR